ncbi:MAG: stage III sporulation protein AG [Sarcina sp.]
MNNEKINQMFEKYLKNKKIAPLIIIVLILILVSFCLSYLSDIRNISKNEENKKTGATVEVTDSPEINTEYEIEQEKELQKILGCIEGVGKVEVNLRIDGSEVKIPAKDTVNKESVTEETDSEGGKRVNSETNGDDKVVMKQENGKNSPYIIETKKPRVTGVIVVAEGAKDSKIKYDMTKAIANLYDISLESVSIFPMEESNK